MPNSLLLPVRMGPGNRERAEPAGLEEPMGLAECVGGGGRGCCRNWEQGQAGNRSCPSSSPAHISFLQAALSDLPPWKCSAPLLTSHRTLALFARWALTIPCPRLFTGSLSGSHSNWRQKTPDTWSSTGLFPWKALALPHVHNAESKNFGFGRNPGQLV